jgi:hypothetical protein
MVIGNVVQYGTVPAERGNKCNALVKIRTMTKVGLYIRMLQPEPDIRLPYKALASISLLRNCISTWKETLTLLISIAVSFKPSFSDTRNILTATKICAKYIRSLLITPIVRKIKNLTESASAAPGVVNLPLKTLLNAPVARDHGKLPSGMRKILTRPVRSCNGGFRNKEKHYVEAEERTSP